MAADHPRRLLLVSQRPLRYEGGGSVRWRFLERELPRHGWVVSVVSARHNPTADQFSGDPREARLAALRAAATGRLGTALRPLWRRAGIQPEAFPPNFAWAFTGRRLVRRAIERERPHVVWATSEHPPGILAAAGAVGPSDPPLVAEFQDLWAGNPYYDAGGPLLPAIQGRALARAAAVVCMTTQARERLASLHPALGERLRVLPNGFDPSLPALRREPRGRGAGPARLIHAGALYGERTVRPLVEALGRPEVAGRAALELVGTMTAESERTVRESPPGVEVTASPPVPWSEAVRRTTGADVVVVVIPPGLGDETAVSSKLYEALALGKPILALTGPRSATASLLSTLGQDAGCAPHDDPAAIADAVRRLIDCPPAPVPLERLGAWDRSRVAEQLVELLDAVTLSGARRPLTGSSWRPSRA